MIKHTHKLADLSFVQLFTKVNTQKRKQVQVHKDKILWNNFSCQGQDLVIEIEILRNIVLTSFSLISEESVHHCPPNNA